ncbi:MAG: hypothetical protein KatS3mg082_1877 [Nitrospiraceae bacterium]|nr:MAG: hypothetical protein KatS3mg082_1877 [Nitrospiraceae bacterium]
MIRPDSANAMQSENRQTVELAVSPRFAQAHGWVVNAITGFLSAYYIEDPRFHFRKRYQEAESGVHVWVCEIEDGMPMARLVKRLLVDLPPGKAEPQPGPNGQARYVIDCCDREPLRS